MFWFVFFPLRAILDRILIFNFRVIELSFPLWRLLRLFLDVGCLVFTYLYFSNFLFWVSLLLPKFFVFYTMNLVLWKNHQTACWTCMKQKTKLSSICFLFTFIAHPITGNIEQTLWSILYMISWGKLVMVCGVLTLKFMMRWLSIWQNMYPQLR